MSRSDIDMVYLDRRAMVRHLRSGLIDAALVSDLNGARLDYLGLRELEGFAENSGEWHSYLIVSTDSLSRFPQRWRVVSQALLDAARGLESQDPEATGLAHAWLRRRNPDATVAALSKTRYVDPAQFTEQLTSDAAFGLDFLQEVLLELGEPVPDTSRSELVDAAWLRLMQEVLDED